MNGIFQVLIVGGSMTAFILLGEVLLRRYEKHRDERDLLAFLNDCDDDHDYIKVTPFGFEAWKTFKYSDLRPGDMIVQALPTVICLDGTSIVISNGTPDKYGRPYGRELVIMHMDGGRLDIVWWDGKHASEFRALEVIQCDKREEGDSVETEPETEKKKPCRTGEPLWVRQP